MVIPGKSSRREDAPMDFLLNVFSGVLVVLVARWFDRRR